MIIRFNVLLMLAFLLVPLFLVAQSKYGHLQYKDGKPWTGTKKDENQLVNYKDGKLEGLQIKYHENRIQTIKTWYSNNLADSVLYDALRIKNISQSLKGYYKDGKPFNGYFIRENNGLKEGVIQLDLYNNGLLEKSFSKSIVANIIESYRTKKDITDDFNKPLLLSVTTVYKDGKPYNGTAYYQFDDRHNIYEQELINGKTSRINVAAFDVNAAGLLVLETATDGYKLSTYNVDEAYSGIEIDTQAIAVKYTQHDKMKGKVILTNNGKKMLGYNIEFHELGDIETPVTKGVQKVFRLSHNKIIVQENSNRVIDTAVRRAAGYIRLDVDLLYDVDISNVQAVAAFFEKNTTQNLLGSLFIDETGLLYGVDIKKNGDTYNYTIYNEGKITHQNTNLTFSALIETLRKENGGNEVND